MEFIKINDRAYYRFTANEQNAREQFEQSILKSDMVNTILQSQIDLFVKAEQDARRAWNSLKEELANALQVDDVSDFCEELSYEWLKGGLEISLQTYEQYQRVEKAKEFRTENDLNIELGK